MIEGLATTLGKALSGSRTTAPFAGSISLSAQRGLPRRGSVQLLMAYADLPWLRAISGKVGFSVGTNQWEVFRETRRGRGVAAKMRRTGVSQRRKALKYHIKQGDVEPLEGHEALEVLEFGNAYMTGASARKVTQVHIDLVGDSFWVLDEGIGTGRPTQYWPTPPTWVTETPFPGGPDRYQFTPQLGGAVSRPFPGEQVIWFRDLDPWNPYGRGTGYGRALADELDTDELAAKHAKSILNNGARPDLIVSFMGATQEQIDVYEKGWLQKFQGAFKQRLPHFSNREVGVTTLENQSLADLQLVELRKFERDLIVEVFGVPPEKMGIIENSNRATIEAADFFYATDVIVPRLVMLRDTLNKRGGFISRWGDDLFLEYVSPVEADRKFQLEVMKAAGHAFVVDEYRELAELENLPDESDGQQRFGTLALTPLDIITDTGDMLEEEETETPPPEMEEMDPVEMAQRSARALAGRLTKEGEPGKVERIIRLVELQVLEDAAVPWIVDTFTEVGVQLVDEIGVGIEFNTENPTARAWIERQAAAKVRHANATTKRALRRTLAEGFAAGETLSKMAQRVEAVFDVAARSRAPLIARTETTRAATYGAQEGLRQSGVEEKQWLATQGAPSDGPGAVRDTHELLDGQHVPVDANFTSTSGATGPGPGEMGSAKEDANCRCTLVAFFPDEARRISGATEKGRTIWKRRESIRLPRERRMVRALQTAFRKQRDAVIGGLD